MNSMLTSEDVYFFYPRAELPADPETFDPDEQWPLLRNGTEAWILQTWARLKRRGHPAKLVEELPERGVLIFENSHKREVAAQLRPGSRLFTVGVRADRNEAWISDVEVVQNPNLEDGYRQRYVPHWPQPGLVPRDVSRGSELQVAGFKGHVENLAQEFRDPAWEEALRERGVIWEGSGAARRGDDERAKCWNDYSNLDILIAVRPVRRGRKLYPRKPATKLYNAWQAGVPAILGPEASFRALRRSPLDYIEVTSAAEALRAIDRLRGDPALYANIVRHGLERGQEFSTTRLEDIWLRLIEQDFLPAAERRLPRRRYDSGIAWVIKRIGRARSHVASWL